MAYPPQPSDGQATAVDNKDIAGTPSLSQDSDAEKVSASQREIQRQTANGDEEEQALGAPDNARPATDAKGEAGSGGDPGLLSRIVSRVSTRSRPSDPGPPPDGGLQAWIAVGCTHLVIFNTWGFINSFGTFQTYYTTLLDRPPSDIAWIGSFQIFLLFFIGTLTGRLTDAGYFRPLLFVGTCFQILGVFTTAQATQYWQLFLSQGVVIGIANGCTFCPSLATLSTYFSKRRSLAIGLAAAGSGTGGLVFPVVVRQLLPKLGFPWTMRIIGFIQLATLVVVNLGLVPRLPPRRSGPLVEWAAFKEPSYCLYAAGSFFCFWAVYVAFFYVASFSRDVIGLRYIDSLNVLLVMNGVGIIGRIGPNYLADILGVVNMFVLFALLGGVTALAWIGVSSSAGMYIWTVFYGIFAGAIQSLFPAGLTSLTTDLSKAGVRIGMIFTINSLSTLTGPPLAGAIISSMDGRYLGTQIFMGVSLLVGMTFLLGARLALAKVKPGWRA